MRLSKLSWVKNIRKKAQKEGKKKQKKCFFRTVGAVPYNGEVQTYVTLVIYTRTREANLVHHAHDTHYDPAFCAQTR